MLIRRHLLGLALLALCCNAWAGNLIGSRILPHIAASGSGFHSEIYLSNASQLEKTVGLVPMSLAGSPGKAVTIRLAAGETKVLPVPQLLGEASYVLVSGSERVTTSVSFVPDQDGAATSYLNEQRVFSRRYQIFPASDDKVNYWEGFAVVNMALSPSELTLTRRDRDGNQIERQVLDLASGEKQVWLTGDLFSSGIRLGESLELDASQPMALMSLAGMSDNLGLWQVEPVVVPRYTSLGFREQQPEELGVDPFEILDVRLNEEILEVDFEFSTTCQYNIDLYMSSGFMESLPVQANVVLVYEILPGFCTRQYETQTHRFDLSSLAQAYRDQYGETGDLRLNLFGSEGKVAEILYTPFP